LAVLPGVVFAWIEENKKPAVAEFRVGEIAVQTRLSDEYVIEEVELPNLNYVDFSEDVIADQTSMLDFVATQIFLEIEILEGSFPIRNHIMLDFSTSPGPLLYFLILEGLDLDETHVNSGNYHELLLGLVPVGNTEETFWRNAIAEYNAGVLAQIEALEMTETDTLRLQIVFWGDYDALSAEAKEDFLTLDYSLNLIVQSVQANKE
jgi:hypothetical protein